MFKQCVKKTSFSDVYDYLFQKLMLSIKHIIHSKRSSQEITIDLSDYISEWEICSHEVSLFFSKSMCVKNRKPETLLEKLETFLILDQYDVCISYPQYLHVTIH